MTAFIQNKRVPLCCIAIALHVFTYGPVSSAITVHVDEYGCDKVVTADSCNAKNDCAGVLNQVFSQSSNSVICLERGQTYQISCAKPHDIGPRHDKYALLIGNQKNATIRAVGDGTAKALLMVDLDVPELCGTVGILRSHGVRLVDIAMDSPRPVSTLVQFVSASAKELVLKVAPDSDLTSYSFDGYNSTRKWLGIVKSLKPVERRPGLEKEPGRWRYVVDNHYYEWKTPYQRLSVTSFDKATRILKLTGKETFSKLSDIEADRFFIIRHQIYGSRGIHIIRSSDVTLAGVQVYHATGMCIVALASDGLSLQGTEILKRGDRPFSCAADGIMTESCRGEVDIANCLVEGTQDDSLNLRNSYYNVKSVDSSRKSVTFEAKMTPIFQYSKGVELQFVNPSTLEIKHISEIVDIKCGQKLGKGCSDDDGEWYACCHYGWGDYVVSFKDPIPASVQIGDAAIMAGWTPKNIRVSSTIFRECRGKGVVLTASDGEVMIENNTFDATVNNGIILQNGPTFGLTYEQGPFAQDVRIRNNKLLVMSKPTAISKGGYKWSLPHRQSQVRNNDAPIQITAAALLKEGETVYNNSAEPVYGKIEISGNQIELGGARRSCENWEYCRSIEHQEYIPAYAISVGSVRRVTISGNSVTDRRKTATGTSVFIPGCQTGCSDVAPHRVKKWNSTCKTITKSVPSLLSDNCNKNPHWISKKFCLQSCADMGFPYDSPKCCPGHPAYINVYGSKSVDIDSSNVCNGKPCEDIIDDLSIERAAIDANEIGPMGRQNGNLVADGDAHEGSVASNTSTGRFGLDHTLGSAAGVVVILAAVLALRYLRK